MAGKTQPVRLRDHKQSVTTDKNSSRQSFPIKRIGPAGRPRAAVPGVILSIPTYGEELNAHPHRHAVVTDGCFRRAGTFHPILEVDTPKMMELFRHKVFKMLLAEEKISATHVEKLLAWKQSGFSV